MILYGKLQINGIKMLKLNKTVEHIILLRDE